MRNSIDYDISISVKDSFNENDICDLLENVIVDEEFIEFINSNNYFEKIYDNDYINDGYLKDMANQTSDKFLLSVGYDENKRRRDILISVKYQNKIYQLIELIFWYSFFHLKKYCADNFHNN